MCKNKQKMIILAILIVSIFYERKIFSELEEDFNQLVKKLKLEYLKKVDPLRYQFFTRTGKFEKKDSLYEYSIKHWIEYLMYKSAGAVYGKVEKKERCPFFYAVTYYIKPYIIFKNAAVDTNGYVILKEGISGVVYADRATVPLGDEVIIFLNDIPTFRLREDVELQKKILETKELPITTHEKYYESLCDHGWVGIVKNNTVGMGFGGGSPLLLPGEEKFLRVPLSEAINIMKRIEKEYKEELKRMQEEK